METWKRFHEKQLTHSMAHYLQAIAALMRAPGGASVSAIAERLAVSKAGVTPWLAASGYGDRLGGVLYNKEGADILARHGADPSLGRPCEAQNKCR